MRLFLNGNEVTLNELKKAFDALDYGPPDGGTYEAIEIFDIDEINKIIYFETIVGSTF